MQKPVATTTIVCGAVLHQDDKYLLVQERQAKAYGLWNLPAGRVDAGETLEEAAIREVKEETGLDIVLLQEVLVIHPAADRPVLHAYTADIIGGVLTVPKAELLDAQWFSYEEIMAMKDKLRTPEYVLGAIDSVRQSA